MMDEIYNNTAQRIASTEKFNVLRTDTKQKKTFAQLREQAFRLATAADPDWNSPRAMHILLIYQKMGRKYMW